ncbi:hypothetical protein ACIG5E_19710 [Kitasatospora sp. NPDC053057]|uniref:hypothetical protein n=1 Tax=Kitasatospora sp. NPDC053057 TaxID=3364062 RepID=UPI0037CC2F97
MSSAAPTRRSRLCRITAGGTGALGLWLFLCVLYASFDTALDTALDTAFGLNIGL